ncbi:hypothetical protein MMP65_13690 [Acinetobacter sp. ANC 3926]|uniref:Uncharacterized protein n=1 Tax=Acinetobacter genomosp. 15BJ TaxID=106651 RepID=R9B3A1_9GAMM|nr:hypothetical protein [Acinetobacter genomosp. 15BJ]EOR08745.1 hypothetical protein F896_01274 [Acinetobacter genomosp. 15BJ]MCH7292500.1 hypothetical protein [Acinetobacter genomosp. 15BJ]
MSSLFYIWDAKQHHPEVTIDSLAQAEYYATNSQCTGFTEKFKNWLLNVENIVTNPELAANFDEEIIGSFTNVTRYLDAADNVFKIEQGLLVKSKYLYKILIETLRQHDLVAFDARSYLFFSQEQIFPDQHNIERMLDTVSPVTQEQLEQFKAIPPNEDELIIFAKQWLKSHLETLNFIDQRKINQYNESIGRYRDVGESIYENILIITSPNPFGYKHISLTSYVQVKPNITIRLLREHPINNYTLQYDPVIHGINSKLLPITQPEQLKNIFQQIYDFLIYDAEKHQDIETLNQWLNHGDEKEYITGLGAISRLVLAKYVNDPLYNQLVAEALPYVNRNRFFKNMTVEKFHERLEQEIKNILEN